VYKEGASYKRKLEKINRMNKGDYFNENMAKWKSRWTE